MLNQSVDFRKHVGMSYVLSKSGPVFVCFVLTTCLFSALTIALSRFACGFFVAIPGGLLLFVWLFLRSKPSKLHAVFDTELSCNIVVVILLSSHD